LPWVDDAVTPFRFRSLAPAADACHDPFNPCCERDGAQMPQPLARLTHDCSAATGAAALAPPSAMLPAEKAPTALPLMSDAEKLLLAADELGDGIGPIGMACVGMACGAHDVLGMDVDQIELEPLARQVPILPYTAMVDLSETGATWADSTGNW